MDWSLVIFILVVAFFVYRGYRNGLLRSVSRVLGILAGYAGAILFAAPVARHIESLLGLRGIVAFVVAALLLFICASIAVSLVFMLIRRLRGERDEESKVSAVGGAMVGLLVGILVAFVAVWVFSFVRDMQPGRDPDLAVANPPPSGVEKLVNRVAGRAVGKAMTLGSAQPVVAQLSAAMIEAPAATTQHAQNLMQSGDFVALFGNPENRRVLDSGDALAVERLPEFQRLLDNPDLQALSNAAGLEQMARDAGQSTETALATQLTDVWVRVQNVKHDPRVQTILEDAEFQQIARAGNPLAVITDDRFVELANIIFADSAAPAGMTRVPAPGDTGLPDARTVKPTEVFSWTDDQGRVHYSDVEPGS